MPDADQKPPSSDCSCSENYPNPGNSATPSLHEWILAEIGTRGSIPFPEYLGMALYDTQRGYYAKSGSQVGRDGDFYTSVSVGPMFGKLLARRFATGWDEAGNPGAWRILEIGAHDGKLAADILLEIRKIRPDAWETLEYAIPEPLPRLRQLQQERLTGIASKLRSIPNISELAAIPLPGFAFGNEILDALPFHLVEMRQGNWKQLFVAADEGFLRFEPRDIAEGSQLSAILDLLGNDFPDGYRTEIRTNFREFLSGISSCLEEGIILFTDYGFAAPEYYDRSRTTGTLRTFSSHQAAEDPLDRPGEKDITAHVDFTELAKSAASLGYRPTAFSTQGSYLTHLAKPMILEGEINDAKSIAQFQSLTHPAHLGASFHAIEFSALGETPPHVAHRLALD
jgi:SAM-dependent MidA family methyltransferase